MKKNHRGKITHVTKLLEKQKIRNVKELGSYKLPIIRNYFRQNDYLCRQHTIKSKNDSS